MPCEKDKFGAGTAFTDQWINGGSMRYAPIKDELFALTPDAPFAKVHELPDAAVVVVLKARTPADDSSIADARETLRNGAATRKRSDAIEAYRDLLRQRADIAINPDIVTGART